MKNMNQKRNIGNEIKRHWQLYVFLVPALLYVAIFCYAPIFGIVIAFQNFSPALGFFNSPWVGLLKFKMFFGSFYFWDILWNTLALSLYSLVVNTIFPIVLALLINEVPFKRFRRFIQTLSYSPYFISLVVLVGMFNLFFSTDGGFVNNILGALGIAPIDFVGDPALFRSTYVLTGLWQGVGWWSIIYIGALANVPQELHEAAALDGASRFQRIIHINLPAITPIILVLFIMSMGSIMSVGFEKVFLMQNSLNREVSEIIATYTYRVSFITVRDLSFGTAVGLFNTVINLILIISANLISKKMTHESLF